MEDSKIVHAGVNQERGLGLIPQEWGEIDMLLKEIDILHQDNPYDIIRA